MISNLEFMADRKHIKYNKTKYVVPKKEGSSFRSSFNADELVR